MNKIQLFIISLVISTITIQAQTIGLNVSSKHVLQNKKNEKHDFKGLMQSYQKQDVLSNSIVFNALSFTPKNRSFIKIKIKDKKLKRLLSWNLLTNNSEVLVDRCTQKIKYQTKRFCLHAKSVFTKHSRELEILNRTDSFQSINLAHLCLNLPQRSNYKISTMQSEEMLKGKVQEEAINIGRLPQEVYLLEAWRFGENQK
jgi:hypothetical protein